MQKSQKKLSSTQLKWIAVLAMLCSHVYKCLLVNHQEFAVLDWFGRISFPVFCFVLVEGYCHTKNKGRYLFRLWVFAVFSEIPFDLAFFGKIVDLRTQNVLFTFVIGFIVMWGMEKMPRKYSICAIFLGMGAAWLFRTDYSFWGIWMIGMFYMLRGMDKEWFAVQTAGLMASAVWYGWKQVFAAGSLFLLQEYNGERGKGGKYFFYMFYPLHLLCLYFLSILIL